MSGKGNAGRGNRPQNTGRELGPVTVPPDYDAATPLFCFRHVVGGFGVAELSKDQGYQVALTLQKLANLAWRDLLLAPRHGVGYEMLPAEIFRAPIPSEFQDRKKFMVFRYSGRQPMAGIRTNATFHVLWIERQYGELYKH